MAVKSSALNAGHALLPEKSMLLISVRGLVDPRAMVQLQGLCKLKKFQ
jgi:hypothetical protein